MKKRLEKIRMFILSVHSNSSSFLWREKQLRIYENPLGEIFIADFR